MTTTIVDNLFDPGAAMRSDPYPVYHRLRATGAVQPTPEGDGWLATSHAAVQAVLRGPGWSSDHRQATAHQRWLESQGAPAEADELLSKVLLFMDPPDHSRVRGLISKAFTPRTVERLRPRIHALVDELLVPARETGSLDVIADVAHPLPVTVICELLGVPAEDREFFREQTRKLAVILDWEITAEQFTEAAGAALAFAAYMVPLFVDRKREPRDDLVSALVAAEEEGDRLGADELLTTVVLLLTAGHETTMNLIGNGMLALLRNRDQLERLRTQPDLIPGAVEELLRYDSPVQLTVRTAKADTQLGGELVKAGDQVVAFIGAANRDPAVFAFADRVDVARDAHRHVSFGAGAHFCLGASLARAEAQVALAALTQLPGVELAVSEPQWRPLVTLRALQSLPVAFRRAC